jgi:hypothetical protein
VPVPRTQAGLFKRPRFDLLSSHFISSSWSRKAQPDKRRIPLLALRVLFYFSFYLSSDKMNPFSGELDCAAVSVTKSTGSYMECCDELGTRTEVPKEILVSCSICYQTRSGIVCILCERFYCHGRQQEDRRCITFLDPAETFKCPRCLAGTQSGWLVRYLVVQKYKTNRI